MGILSVDRKWLRPDLVLNRLSQPGGTCEAAFFNLSLLSFSKHLTDIYLVALAVKHEGFLVTFDRRITVTAIPGATSKHLLVPE